MTDRELLEAAARAAGIERSVGGDLWSSARGQLWNPLTDDGDALRLAVRLRLDVLTYQLQDGDFRRVAVTLESCGSISYVEQGNEFGSSLDDAGMVRRAIVRAAAAMANSKAACDNA